MNDLLGREADRISQDEIIILRAIEARAGDVFNVYVSESGGLLRSQQIIAIAEAAGIPCLTATPAAPPASAVSRKLRREILLCRMVFSSLDISESGHQRSRYLETPR